MSEKSSFAELFEIFKQKGELLLNKLSELRNTIQFPILFHLQTNIVPWCVSQVYDYVTELENEEKKDVDVIVFSLGGDADTAYHLGRILHKSVKGNLTFIVPRVAASAATLLTFSGNKILMIPPSALGPIDPQIEISPRRFVSAKSLRDTLELFIGKILEQRNPAKSTVEAFLEKLPLTEVVDYERLLEHTEDLATELLTLRMVKDREKAKEIAKKFVRGFKYHGRNVTMEECIELGLQVEELAEEERNPVWEFSKLWENIALITAEEGSDVKPFKIGKGVAFLPIKVAQTTEEKESVVETMVSRLSKIK
jgi:hypothetical protein